MPLKLLRPPTGKSYLHKGAKDQIGLEVEVFVPGSLGDKEAPWASILAHMGFTKLLHELHQTTKRSKIKALFQPNPITIKAGERRLTVKIRTTSDVSLRVLVAEIRKAFEPLTILVGEGLEVFNGLRSTTLLGDEVDAYLAELAANRCRSCGKRIEPPDDPAFAVLVAEILNADHRTVEDVITAIAEEDPLGVPTFVYKVA